MSVPEDLIQEIVSYEPGLICAIMSPKTKRVPKYIQPVFYSVEFARHCILDDKYQYFDRIVDRISNDQLENLLVDAVYNGRKRISITILKTIKSRGKTVSETTKHSCLWHAITRDDSCRLFKLLMQFLTPTGNVLNMLFYECVFNNHEEALGILEEEIAS